MKIQDAVFITILFFVFLLFYKKPKVFFAAGLLLIGLSIPLFYMWIFFTAQRLVYYAAGFFLIGLLLSLSFYIKSLYNKKYE